MKRTLLAFCVLCCAAVTLEIWLTPQNSTWAKGKDAAAHDTIPTPTHTPAAWVYLPALYRLIGVPVNKTDETDNVCAGSAFVSSHGILLPLVCKP